MSSVLIRKHWCNSLVKLPTFIDSQVQLGKLANEKYTNIPVVQSEKAIPNSPHGPPLQEIEIFIGWWVWNFIQNKFDLEYMVWSELKFLYADESESSYETNFS